MSNDCLSKKEEDTICKNISDWDQYDWIPFVGPTLKSVYQNETKSSKELGEELKNAKEKLDKMVTTWRETITGTVYKNSQLISNMLNLIAGPKGTDVKSTDSYIGLVSALTVEPVAERQGYIIVTVISMIVLFFFIFPKIINR